MDASKSCSSFQQNLLFFFVTPMFVILYVILSIHNIPSIHSLVLCEQLNNTFRASELILRIVPAVACRVNDVLLRVNDLDLSNASKERLVETIQASSDSVTFKVRRRKPIGRCNISVEFPFNRKGLSFNGYLNSSHLRKGFSSALPPNCWPWYLV